MSGVLVRKILALGLVALVVFVGTGCSRTGSSTTPAAQAAVSPTADAEPTATIASAPTTGATATATRRASPAATPTTVARAATPTTGRATPTTTRPAAATPVGTPLPTLATGQTYRDPQARFSFTIPNNWNQVQAAGADVAFQSPAAPNAVPATVNVVIEKLPSASVTLDEYDRAGETNLKQQFADYRQVSHTQVIVDGRPAYKRVYTATIANRLLQVQQIYLIDRDTAYILTCGATQDTFATYTAVFDQISGTFKLGVP